MKLPDDIQQLFARAKQEGAPEIDVSQRVLQRLAEAPKVKPLRDPLPLLAAFSLTTALIVMLAVYTTWDTFQDPLMFLVEPIRVALP